MKKINFEVQLQYWSQIVRILKIIKVYNGGQLDKLAFFVHRPHLHMREFLVACGGSVCRSGTQYESSVDVVDGSSERQTDLEGAARDSLIII